MKRRIISILAAVLIVVVAVPLDGLAGPPPGMPPRNWDFPADDNARFFLICDGPAAPAAIDALNIQGSDVFESASRAGVVALSQWVGEHDGIGPGDELVLNLFPDASYVATVDRISMDVNGVVSVRGRLLDYPQGYVILSTHEGRTRASIVVPEIGQHYLLFHDPRSNAHFLAELDPDMMDMLQEAPPLLSPPSDGENEGELVALDGYGATGSGPEDPATIDVMVVYTGAAEDWASTRGGIESIIAQSMETAQLVMDNSDTGVTFQLVHTASVTYTEANHAGTDLTRLTGTTDGYMDEVHQWRDEYGADLVSLFAYVSTYGGVAWLLGSPSGQPAYGFSITRVQQAATGYTHIHEMGHNMGAHHHKDQNVQPGPGLFNYSAGWRWVASDGRRWCTVMTYESGTYFPDGQTHSRLPYFSNPHVSHQGSPTGDTSHGDNARTIREVKHAIAAYRSSQSAPPSLTTGTATGVDTDSATLHGALDSLGDCPSVDFSFEWWTDPVHKNETASQSMSAPGPSSASLTGLEPETVYHFRAKGVADGVTVHGNELSFTTLPAEPGPAVAITISPQDATVTAGESQAYAATASDELGNEFDVTAETVFSIDQAAGGAWHGNVYTSEAAGSWTVTANYGDLADTATLSIEQEPDIHVALSATPTSVSQAGDVITYTCTVTNTGGVTLTGISVTDSRLGNITPDTTTLAPGASTTSTGTYTVSQADIDSGADIVNTATVTCDQGVTDSDNATVTVQAPELASVAISPTDHSGRGWPEEDVVYEFTVQNTGNVPDTYDISVTSDWGSSVTPQALTLEPEASATITVSHSVPAGAAPRDSDAGMVEAVSPQSEAHASATFTTSARVSSVAVTPDTQSATGAPGETVQYTYTISNMGTEDDVYDLATVSAWPSSVSPGSIVLPEGAAAEVTVAHTVPADARDQDFDSGVFTVSLQADVSVATAVTFITTAEEEPEPSPPVINTFRLTNNSNPAWARVTVDWAVSDEDGDLSTVTVLMVLNGTIVNSATFSVAGYEASGICQLRHRSRGSTAYDIVLIVTDALGNTVSRTEPFSS